MHPEQGIPFTTFPFLSDAINKNMYEWNQIFTLNYPIVLGVINLFIWPIPLYFLFKRYNYNYTELVSALIYFYSTIVIIIMISSIIFNPLSGQNLPIELVSMIALLYLTYAFTNFFQHGRISFYPLRIITSLLCILIFRIFLLPFSMALLFPLK